MPPGIRCGGGAAALPVAWQNWTMRITVNIPDVLAAQARERGLSVEVYVEQVLAKKCNEHASEAGIEERSTIAEAIDRIREIGKGNKLDGENIKDWIHEGHKS
jgi:post-segregation antitoxin (ccd killing protein)